MPSKIRRKATARRPGVPGAFSGPSNGASRVHKSSGICHIVGAAVLVLIASLLLPKGKSNSSRPHSQVFVQTLRRMRIAAHHQDATLRFMGITSPYLLAIDDEIVTIFNGAGL